MSLSAGLVAQRLSGLLHRASNLRQLLYKAGCEGQSLHDSTGKTHHFDIHFGVLFRVPGRVSVGAPIKLDSGPESVLAGYAQDKAIRTIGSIGEG